MDSLCRPGTEEGGSRRQRGIATSRGMHEMSLCQGIIDVLQQAAKEQGFTRVVAVGLAVGQLVGIEQNQLRTGFALLSRHTLAENARLEIEDVAGEAFCPYCEQQVAIDHRYRACPSCHAWGLQLLQGNELKISHLEVI